MTIWTFGQSILGRSAGRVTSRSVARPGFARRLTTSFAHGMVLTVTAVSSSYAATPQTWTGWTLNPASGCSIAAQVPFLNSNGQVGANVAVYCPRDTWLTVRERVRSDRTLDYDVTVAISGCWATGTCPILEPAGTRYYFALCPKTSSRVTHGYHSDILIYPGTNSYQATGIRSGSATLSPYCGH